MEDAPQVEAAAPVADIVPESPEHMALAQRNAQRIAKLSQSGAQIPTGEMYIRIMLEELCGHRIAAVRLKFERELEMILDQAEPQVARARILAGGPGAPNGQRPNG